MPHRVQLIHWNRAEAAERAARIRGLGYPVTASPPSGPEAMREMIESPPAAIVIDLSRMPSHGRDIALALRQRKATRHIPLVFVEGDLEKVARIRMLLPDATYTDWGLLRVSLPRAITEPLTAPVVPKSPLEAYKGTPLVKKLGIKANTAVALIGAPPDFEQTLGDLPEGVTLRKRPSAACGLALWFIRSRRELEDGIDAIPARIGEAPLWIVWPKKASSMRSDLTQSIVRKIGMASGLVDYKICAVDETWSGLLFRRKKRKR